jgi:hypothetical protein
MRCEFSLQISLRAGKPRLETGSQTTASTTKQFLQTGCSGRYAEFAAQAVT